MNIKDEREIKLVGVEQNHYYDINIQETVTKKNIYFGGKG